MGWLLLLHALGVKTTRWAQRGLQKLVKQMPPDGKVWVIWIGPTVRSLALLAQVTREHGWQTIGHVKLSGFSSQVPAVKTLLSILSSSIPPHAISAVLYSGHASGWMLGGWRRPDPFMTLEEFNEIVLDRFRPQLVAWNTCLMGSLSTLYGLPSYVKFAIASPGLHPSKTLLYATQAFADSTAHARHVAASPLQTKRLARAMSAEWHHHASDDPERCILVFDVERVKKLAPAIRRAWPQLVFDKRAQLHNSPGDGHLFDLWTAARHLPELQRQVLKCVLNSRQALSKNDKTTNGSRCCFPCRRTRSMSVEARPPKKWQEIHGRAKWTRFLGVVAPHPRPKMSPPHALPKHTAFPTIPRNLLKNKKL